MNVNLVDRDLYKLKQTEGGMSAEELKNKMSEKLKYVLSDKETYDPFEKQKKLKLSKQIIIPSKFTFHDKIHTYGGKIEDPFRTNILNPHEMEERVFTHAEHQKLGFKKLEGIKQINKTFDTVKNI